MTRREVGIENARREAGKLLRRFGVESVNHVNVEGFAARLNIALVEAPLDGASAQLVVARGRASIVLSDRLTDPAARRRAIAHELGQRRKGRESRRRLFHEPTLHLYSRADWPASSQSETEERELRREMLGDAD